MFYKNIAEMYAHSRPAYPQEIFNLILSHIPEEQRKAYVDLGCGTGELLIPLSIFFEKNIGVDPDEDMLRVAHNKVQRHGVCCELIKNKAESYLASLPHDCKISLVTAGRCFHWMDQLLVTQLTYDHLIQGGMFATMGEASGGIWRRESEWGNAVRKIIFEAFPNKKKFVPAQGHYVPIGQMKKNLATVNWSQIIDTCIEVEQLWTIDTILNLFYSASGFLDWLADEKAVFDEMARAALLNINPTGAFKDTSTFGITLHIK